MTNQYDVVQPLQFSFSHTPMQAFTAALQRKQQMYDVNRAAAEELASQMIESLPQDRARANAIQQDIQNSIDKLVSGSQGDYSRITSGLYGLKRDIKRTMGPGGEGYAIQSNRQRFLDADEMEKERLAKGEINQNQYEFWRTHTMNNYKGAGTQNMLTGNYNILTPEQIAKYYDPTEIGMEIAKEMEPFALSMEVDQVSGDWIITTEEGIKVLPADYVRDVVGNRIMQHEGYRNYFDQMSKFTGSKLDMEDYIFDSVAPTIAAAFQRQDISQRRSLKERGYGLARFKASLEESMMRDLFGTSFAPATQAGDPSSFKPLDRSKGGFAPNKVTSSDVLTAYGTGEPGVYADEGAIKDAQNFDYSKFAYTERAINNPNVDAQILQKVVEANPREQGQSLEDYNNMIEAKYNQSGKQSEVFQNEVYTLGEKQSDALRNGLVVNALNSGLANVRPTKNGQVGQPMTFSEAIKRAGLKEKDVWNDDGSLRLRPTSIHTGKSTLAGAITLAVPGNPDKQLVLEGWSNQVESAVQPFREVANSKRGKISGYIPITQDGGIGISSTRDFKQELDGTVRERTSFFYTVPTKDGNIRRANDEEVNQVVNQLGLPPVPNLGIASEVTGLGSLIQQYVPLGATKSDYTPIPFNR